MIRLLKPPLTIGIIVFVLSLITLDQVIGPANCRDGWASSSIGRQGACSWHGGVDRTPAVRRFLGSVLAGIAAGGIAGAVREGRSGAAETQVPPAPSPSGEPDPL